jgi:hypothetical protein
MYFPVRSRHAPKRNVLPTQPLRDDAARRQIAELVVQVDELRRELKIQFTRIAQLQADFDEVKQLLLTSRRRK